MSTPFYNASMCKRSSWRLALAFFFLSLVSSGDPATEATLQDVKNAVHGVDTSVQLLTTDFHDMQQFWTETRRDNMLPAYSDIHALRLSIENAFGNSGSSLTSGPWLKEFLFGSQSDPWYTQYPQFRTLKHFARGASSPSVYPENSVGDQSLTFFLSTTLGGMFDSANGPVAYQNDWNNYFTTNSTFFRIRSASGNIGPGGSMYASFPIWLAEAMRRQIFNTTNLVTADWRTLNGSTNPVQAVSAAVTDEQLANSSFSNSVAAIDQQLEDMRPEEGGTPTGYDNTEDFSSASSLIGPDDGETSWSPAILLATSSQVSDIASAAGIQAASLPTIEFSPYSHASISSGINRLSTAMVSVWNWMRSLAVLGIVIYWYRKCRGLATAIYCGNRRAG